MSFQQKQWKNRLVEYPGRFNYEKVHDIENAVDLTRAEGAVAEPGDKLNAETMNNLEHRIAKDSNELHKQSNEAWNMADEALGEIAALSFTVDNGFARVEEQFVLVDTATKDCLGEAKAHADSGTATLRGEALLKTDYDKNNNGKVDRAELADTAANASQLNGQAASYYATAADVLTKTNTTAYTPTAGYHPATKAYVDSAVGSGETAANALRLNGQDASYYAKASELNNKANIADVLTKTNTTPYAPSDLYHPATKAFVEMYIDGIWSHINDYLMYRTGSVMTGSLYMGEPNTNGGGIYFRAQGGDSFVVQELNELVFHTSNNIHFQQGTAGNYAYAYAKAFIQAQSTKRVKENIEALDLAETKKFLNAPVVSFDYKKDAMFYDGKRHIGTIAEDIADINEAYIIRDADGEVEAVRYDLLTVPLLQLVQDLYQRVEVLEEKLKDK